MSRPEIPCNADSVDWIGPDSSTKEALGLSHCAYIPPGASPANPAPVVVMVHGWAGDAGSMWVFRQTVPEGVAVITPQAPLPTDEGGYGWFTYREARFKPDEGLLEAAYEKFSHFLFNLPGHYPIDPTRLVLMGFSQGAMMCNVFVFSQPYDAIGVASLAGALPPIYDDEPQTNLLAGLPVFIAHGERDDVIPVEEARHARKIFTKFGADVTYGEYPSAHKMHLDGIKKLKSWVSRFFPGGA